MVLKQRNVRDTKEFPRNDARRESSRKRKQSKLRLAFRGCFQLLLIVLFLATIFVYAVGRDRIELQLMRFFRDLSRAKAHKNLHGTSSLVSLFAGREEILPLNGNTAYDDDYGVWLTAEELREFDGKEPEKPLYLAIKGRIYDVTAGAAFYGPGRSYHHFVGRDASRAFATGCTKGDCLVSSLAGLEEFLQLEVERWVELYEYHDKYKFIGKLVPDPVEVELEKEHLHQLRQQSFLQGDLGPTQLFVKGKAAFARRDDDEAAALWDAALVKLGEPSLGDAVETNELRADIYVHKASQAQRLGRFGAAIEIYREALLSLERSLTAEEYKVSTLVGRALVDLAAAEYLDNQTVEGASKSRKGFHEGIQIYENALNALKPEDNKDTSMKIVAQLCNTKVNLAKLEERLGDKDTAKSVLQSALDTIEVFVDEHELSSNSENKVVMLLAKVKRTIKDGVVALSQQRNKV